MRPLTAFKVLTFVALAGMIFSGYLTYYNVLGPGCHKAIITCGTTQVVKIFGLPTCVYGLTMYTVVFVLSILGWVKPGKTYGLIRAVFTIGLIGTLFSVGLSIYEIWFLTPPPVTLPACVYGGILFLTIFITSWVGLRASKRMGTPIAPAAPINPGSAAA